MSASDPTPQWRVIASINGMMVDGILAAVISSTNTFAADTFTVTFAIGPSPLGDLTFWSGLSNAVVEVSAQSACGTPVLINGQADSVSIDPIRGIAIIDGRDLSAAMVDGYRQQDFVNQTASEVVQAIASSYGLNSVVDSTSGYVGRYFSDGYTRLSLGQFSRLRSDWDLIVELAREIGYDAYVLQNTLYFRSSATTAAAPSYLSMWDVETVRMDKTLTIKPTASARVQTWSSQDMRSYTALSSGSGAQPFLFASSNLTSQQASNLAARYAMELTRLISVLHIEMPWNLSLSPRMSFQLGGTNSSLDELYTIESVERRYNSVSGCRQYIRAIPNT